MRVIAALAFGLCFLVPGLAPAVRPADSRIILGFDRQLDTWTVKARTRLLPSQGPTPVWSLTGRVLCHGDVCPGSRARIDGTVRSPGGVFEASARFADGTTCTFNATLDDPAAPTRQTCTDRDGNVTLDRPLHVGLCRCLVVRARPGPAFCATEPCPY